MSKPEVLTPDVIEEVPLEKQIENSLVKNNVTDKVINALKKQYGGMKLKALDDKKGYLEIKEARNAVRKVGILAEKCCKLGREDAVKIQKLWLAKEKEVLDKIGEVQNPLDAEMKKFEDEKERLDQLEIQRKEEQFMKRQTTLLKMEAVYSGNSFTLGSVSYELDNIKEADEEIWNDTILPKYQREFAKVEAEKAEIEKQKKEAEDKLRAEQEQLRVQQEELNKQREEMRLQQEALNKEKEKAIQEMKDKQAAQNKNRMNQIMAMGMVYKFDDKAFSIYDVFVAELEITTLTDVEWDELIKKITPVISERKQDAENKRLAEIELEKQQAMELAATKERERIEEEQIQAEIKRQIEEQKKLEEAAKASDKDKWIALVGSINSILIPEFKSSVYKGKLAVLKEKFEEINSL